MTQHNLPGQLGISVRHVGHFSRRVAQRADDVAQGQEAAVDGDSLLGPIAGRSRSLQSFGSGQGDKVKLGGQGLDLARGAAAAGRNRFCC